MTKRRAEVKDYLKEIIIGEGGESERTVRVPKPVGKKWRKMIGPLSSFVLGFADKNINLDEDEVDGQDMVKIKNLLDAISEMWEDEEFENTYLPAVLGLDNPKGLEWLDTHLDRNEAISAFFEAAMLIVAGSDINSEETKEALKNSDGDAQADE